VEAGFPDRSRSNKKPERDDDSPTKVILALVEFVPPVKNLAAVDAGAAAFADIAFTTDAFSTIMLGMAQAVGIGESRIANADTAVRDRSCSGETA
jgi:hypothetical protein